MFIGRERELNLLKGLLRKNGSSLAIVRGRRRIGKSTLIEKFGGTAERFLEFQGLPPREGITQLDQLRTFSEQLARQTGLPVMGFEGWPQALALLANQVHDEQTVILFDEISWFAGNEKDFAGNLKIAWDTEFKKKKQVVLVLCGSVSSWIDQNILNNTGFVGRISLQIDLQPLSLYYCNLFWGKSTARISSLEKLKILSVTGGVPRYLEEIDTTESAEATIKRLCFEPEGMLFLEFDQIFSAIFTRRAGAYAEILRILSSGSHGLTEIAKESGNERSGHLSSYLADLELSGFIRKDTVYIPGNARKTRLQRYRLADNYTRFYLRYIENKHNTIKQGLYKRHTSLASIIRWDVILGLQFENLVLDNIQTLFPLLHIEPATIMSAAPYFQRKTLRHKACQIDLLIQTKHTLYVCEIKCRLKIGAEITTELQEKIARLKPPGTLSVRTVLIYQGVIDQALQKEGYFDWIVSFKDMLNARGND